MKFKFNPTGAEAMKIVESNGFTYRGQLEVKNPINKKFRLYDVFSRNGKTYVIKNFDTRMGMCEMSPKDFTKIQSATTWIN